MVNNWLITGGCGFLGTALIRHLIQRKLARNIRIIDNLSVGTRKDLSDVCGYKETEMKSESIISRATSNVVELIVGDIRDAETALICTRGIDIVVHFAANTGVPASVENPKLDMECNVVGTFNMLEAARKCDVKRFVFASSGAPLGEVFPPIHEEIAPHPVSPYGASKLAGEGYCSAYYKSYGLKTVALRFSNVYGPGSSHKSSVVAKFIKQALGKRDLVIFGDGTQTRDFIYIDDLIDAVVLGATKSGIAGEIFQIATGKETTVSEISQILKRMIYKKTGHMPVIINANPRIGDVRRNFSDTSKSRSMLDWVCNRPLKDGIESTVDWFIASNDKS